MSRLSRRDWLRLSSAGVMAHSMSGWLETLAADTATNPKRKRACILLWMNGGPSQMDTFDLKPGHANGGPFKEIKTAAPGLRISEHLPKIARFGDRMAVIRSMSTKEGDHGRASFLMRTGYQPTGPIQYPTLGSLVAKETRGRGRAAAQLRQHRAVPLLQPRRLRPRLPGPAVRPAHRRGRQSVLPAAGPDATSRRSRCRTSTCPAASIAPTPTPASTCWSRWRAIFSPIIPASRR